MMRGDEPFRTYYLSKLLDLYEAICQVEDPVSQI